MDFLLIELVLWGGLLFLFWALKDGLGRVESDIESLSLFDDARSRMKTAPQKSVSKPEHLAEPIGVYGSTTIYRYAVIDGERYQFDYAWPIDDLNSLRPDQRCIHPGLVYVRCDEEQLSRNA